ncbi:hypothetical protein, partial [Mesorhizobium sp. M1A.T.Ca.IN.004.03.1.1]|uniref:hypothetical protein n=1 Tax=Mesorhizobium sp. M1A.T.Ca.IN.004.03.1.1 TaxID=2496795 RepID=UPI0019D08948
IVASIATMKVASMIVATISTRFERCAAFDMTILFGCSADAGNIGRLARCGAMCRLRSDAVPLRPQVRPVKQAAIGF